MSSSLFILTITAFMLSIVGALLISFFRSKIPPAVIKGLIIYHFLIGGIWLTARLSGDYLLASANQGYLFLAFCCSGILVAGIVLRSAFKLYVKIYFSLFLFLVFVFIASPSRLIAFISSGNISVQEFKKFRLTENYFIVEQKIDNNRAGKSNYKLVKENGMFHKTLARNIFLPEKTDSISLLTINPGTNTIIKAYFIRNNNTDSSIIEIQWENQANKNPVKGVKNI
jgi:hypothetical protein